MDQSTISRYCNIERPPRPHLLRYMADRLETSVAELMGKEEAKTPKRLRLLGDSVIPVSPPDQHVCKALNDLKGRWKRRSRERDTIKHLIAALFAENADQILTWLDEP